MKGPQQKPLKELITSQILSRSNDLAHPRPLNFKIIRWDETFKITHLKIFGYQSIKKMPQKMTFFHRGCED